ncbi:hypothetical protein Gogos_013265 [Gossypium gossypioides]|uniref:Uncharacterized protein n=1 Tax=Gossypium gossypioides TaxID=34282 RepID=A0A7J9BV09_GOSGO|nr:hypothetical protein [Gossypium gossypioides]
MARIGTSAAHIVLAIFAVAMFAVSGTMAQDIAPSPAMATGAGSALPLSAVFLCSSMLERGFGDLEIQLEAAKGDLNRATGFTLVGKIHANKTLNRRGLKGFCRASGDFGEWPIDGNGFLLELEEVGSGSNDPRAGLY